MHCEVEVFTSVAKSCFLGSSEDRGGRSVSKEEASGRERRNETLRASGKVGGAVTTRENTA